MNFLSAKETHRPQKVGGFLLLSVLCEFLLAFLDNMVQKKGNNRRFAGGEQIVRAGFDVEVSARG